jgi:hypothetical protein
MAISESTSQQLNSGKPKSCRHLTVGYLPGSTSKKGCRPLISISGRWMEDAGFTIGSKVNVESSHGRLVIELVPPGTEYKVSRPRRAYISERMVMTVYRPPSAGVSRTDLGGDAS